MHIIIKTRINNIERPLQNSVVYFNRPPPKPNSATLVNTYKPTSPNSLFSEDKYCGGIRFIVPTKLPLLSLPCKEKLWKYDNTQHTMFNIVMRISNKKRDGSNGAHHRLLLRWIRLFFVGSTHFYV